MKRIAIILLVLVLCLSITGCGRRQYANPGRADGSQPEERSEGNFLTRLFGGSDSGSKTADDAPKSDDTEQSGSAEGGSTGDKSAAEGLHITAPEVQQSVNYDTDDAPESVNTYNYNIGGRTVTISYGDGMTVGEAGGMAVVKYGGNALYVDYVGDDFSAVRDNPSIYLYNYGFEHIVTMVQDNFGPITGTAEDIKETSVKDGELSRFEGTIQCGDTLVYIIASVKMLDGGADCVIETSVCDAGNAMIFNNIEVR